MTEPRHRAGREGGFTLIELMISMLIGSILIGFVLAAYVRMSTALKHQNSVTELQQTVRAARAQVTQDLLLAGFGVTRFRTATGAFGSTTATDLLPFQVVNNAYGTGPDLVRIYYANGAASARVTDFSANTQVQVDSSAAFAVGNIIVVTSPVQVNVGTRTVIEYDACVLQITAIAPTLISFDATGNSYNNAANNHCDQVRGAINGGAEGIVYGFVARAYRIDPTRPEISPFQASASGELLPNDWADLGVGFTDFQLATRYFEDADAVDLDGDGDATRDWYSSENQENPDLTGERPANAIPIAATISIAVRTRYEVSGVATSATPAFIDTLNPTHNRMGDSNSINLTLPDASLPIEHRGDHLYRWDSSTIDTRNLGMAR